MTLPLRMALRPILSILILFSLPSCGDSPVEPGGNEPSEELLYYTPEQGLFVLDIQTGEVTQITSGSIRIPISAPAVQWSPDGERIAFAGMDDPSPLAVADLFVVNADGTNLRRITQTAARESDPRWSPDGTQLAYSRFDSGVGTDLMVVDVDGGSPTALVTDMAAGNATWSPDGQRIGFIGGCTAEAPCREGETSSEIFVVEVDGTGLRRLTNDLFFVHDLQWSPAGDRLVYYEVPAPGREGEIFTIRADGSNRRPITSNSSREERPLWAPDGERIAFRGFSTGAPAIHVINADGSNEIILDSPETDFEIRPSWNPDGERIAFTGCLDPEEGDCAGPGDDNFDLFVINADGSNLQQITNTPQTELLVGWRPSSP